MSALTKCNYCTLQWMRADAAERGAEVVVSREPVGIESWLKVQYSDEDEPAAFFKALTAHCVCDS